MMSQMIGKKCKTPFGIYSVWFRCWGEEGEQGRAGRWALSASLASLERKPSGLRIHPNAPNTNTHKRHEIRE